MNTCRFTLALLAAFSLSGCSSSPSTTNDKNAVPRASPSEAVVLGDLQVSIDKVEVGRSRLKSLSPAFANQEMWSDGVHLVVTVTLHNHTKDKKVDYYPWSFRDDSPPDANYAAPKARDDRGNNYARQSPGVEAVVFGAKSARVSIYPGMKETDVLVFEHPVDGFTHIDIDLPGKSYGQAGDVRFRVQAADIKK